MDGPESLGRVAHPGVELLHVGESRLVCLAESGILYRRETDEDPFEFVLIFRVVHIVFLQLNPNLVIFTE
jgi:hypothetical protein